jgi:hypothetical protein
MSASADGKSYKIRDLLDDSMTHVPSGQVSHVSRTEASQYLRSELLPPATPGVPVTPMSATAGLLVQLVRSWRGGSSGGNGDDADGNDQALRSKLVIGKLLRPDPAGSSSSDKMSNAGVTKKWFVQWPDGSELSHSIGKGGEFALAHLHMHRLAGAPLQLGHMDAAQVYWG